jgi:hypothetical protein
MIRVLLWKEYREHRAIWLSLALVGGVGLFALSHLIPSFWGLSYEGTRDSLRSVAVLFAWTYGLVCGSMLLANEAETGALAFLDQLPLRRWQLWWIKCLFGLILLALQLAVLMGVVLGLDIADTPRQLAATLGGMIAFGLFAFSWGLLFSARGEYVLNVIGLAIVGQITSIVATALLFFVLGSVLAFLRFEVGVGGQLVAVVFMGSIVLALIFAPFLVSLRLFTRLDRLRRNPSQRGGEHHEAPPLGISWVRILWLSYAQMRRMLLGLSLVAFVLGLVLPLMGPMGWPLLTGLIGVLCGVTVWSDEQFSSAFRFLGDQRFPLGRVWLVKLGSRFALTAFASWVLLLPSLVMASIHRIEAHSPNEGVPFWIDLFHCDLVGPIIPLWAHLSLWPIFGFTTGQLCGLLFRKSLVAGVVSLAAAGLFVSFWVPSLLGLGLHVWQLAGVPLALLTASALLMPAWTADRLLARGTFVRAGAALLAAGLWIAGGLWYRVAEIPDVPEPFDMDAFTANVPSLAPETNPAGMKIRGTWFQVQQVTQDLYNELKSEVKIVGPNAPAPRNSLHLQLETALSNGWTRGSPELEDWLNRQFQNDWYHQLSEVADMPVGAVEDAKILTTNTVLQHRWHVLHDVIGILAARGLQRQAHGDPQTFVDNLRVGLALSRNFRNRTPPSVALIGRNAETRFLGSAFDLWLRNLGKMDSQVLERLGEVLREHERLRPDDADVFKVQYLLAQNRLEFEPAKMIENHLPVPVQAAKEREELRQAECEAAALFWRIPWEHKRHERMLRMAAQPSSHRRAESWRELLFESLMSPIRRWPSDQRSLVELRVALLKTALRLYQMRHDGRLPKTLTELVPECLPFLPSDPYDGQPLRYRISKGEGISWFDGSTQKVEAGQAVLWSVGTDGIDQGGVRQEHESAFHPTNSDLIYLVPVPS